MRTTIILLCVVVAVLSVAVAVLWFGRENGFGAAYPSQRTGLASEPAAAVSVHDRDPAAANANADRRVAEMLQRLDALSAEVDQLKASTNRSSIAAPPPSETEFMDRHRATIVQVIDEETRNRDWDKAVAYSQELAVGMASKWGLPESMKPALREFGTEYMRRARAILDEFCSKWEDVKREGTPEQARWSQEWRALYAWGQGRLAEVDSARATEMWEWFQSQEGGLSYQFMPH